MSFKHSDNLRREIEKWLAEDLISADQAQKLFNRYELDRERPWYKDSGSILKAVGIVFVVMGIFLIISANWDSIPTVGRMLLGLLPLLGSYALSFHFYQKQDWRNIELSLYFATLVFGANIALQSQIFHISAYFPNGLLFWLFAAMPLVFYFRSPIYVVTFLGLYMLWLGFQTEYEQFNPLSFLILSIFAFVLYAKPQQVGTVVFGFALYGALLNAIIFLRRHISVFDHGSFYSYLTFTAAYVLCYQSLLLFLQKRLSETFIRQLSSLLRLVLISWIFVLSFIEPAKDFYRSWGKVFPWFWENYLLAIIGTVLFVRFAPRNLESLVNWGLAAFFFATFLIPDETLYCIFANLICLAYAVWKIYYGITEKYKASFMWGIAYLLIWAIGKYLSLVENYEITAIIMILCGVGTYFINKLWDERYEK